MYLNYNDWNFSFLLAIRISNSNFTLNTLSSIANQAASLPLNMRSHRVFN